MPQTQGAQNEKFLESCWCQAAVVKVLLAGDKFEAVGKIKGADWIVVSQDEQMVEYVYVPLVGRAPESASQTTQTMTKAGHRPAIELDAIEEQQAIELDAEGLVAEEGSATSERRTMNMEVANETGQTEHSTFDACKGTDGVWEIF